MLNIAPTRTPVKQRIKKLDHISVTQPRRSLRMLGEEGTPFILRKKIWYFYDVVISFKACGAAIYRAALGVREGTTICRTLKKGGPRRTSEAPNQINHEKENDPLTRGFMKGTSKP